MRIVLNKKEAQEFVAIALVEALFPGRRMKVNSVDWVKYNEEVTIELEEDDAHIQAAERALGKLGGRPPPAQSRPERTVIQSFDAKQNAADEPL